MKKPEVKLSNSDGNVFAIIGAVMKSLRNAGMQEKAKEFEKKAFSCEDYNAVLKLCFQYCEVI